MELISNDARSVHDIAISELSAFGDQENTVWACIRRVVEVTDQHWQLEEATYKGAFKDSDLDEFNKWNWDDHHHGVEYRSCWSTDPENWHASDAGVEARIILAGGGPAVKIVAEFDGYGATDNFYFEHSWWDAWQKIELKDIHRLSEQSSNYVYYMVERYIQQVAGWIQEM
tara:strand:- start:341 stop:853 length:513 start_codon:yes stop_codon:yes gene_type:complete